MEYPTGPKKLEDKLMLRTAALIATIGASLASAIVPTQALARVRHHHHHHYGVPGSVHVHRLPPNAYGSAWPHAVHPVIPYPIWNYEDDSSCAANPGGTCS